MAALATVAAIRTHWDCLENEMDQKYSLQQFGQQIKSKYPQYKDMGDEDVANAVLKKYPQYQDRVAVTSPAPEKSVEGFLNNIANSGGNLIKGTVDAVTHPVDTATNLAKVAEGGLKNTGDVLKSIPVVGDMAGKAYDQSLFGRSSQAFTQMVPDAEEKASAVGQFFDKRYGVSDVGKGDFKSAAQKTGNTAYEDPIGALLDLSTLLSAGGTSAAKVGEITNATKVANVGNKVAEVGKAIDPINAAVKTAGKVTTPLKGTGAAAEKVGGLVENEAKNIPLGGVKITPTQMKKFMDENHVSVEDFIKQEGLTGNPVELGVQKMEDLQNKYDDAVLRSGKTVTKDEVRASFDKQIASLSSDENAFIPEAQLMVQKLEQRRDMFLQAMGKNNEIGVDQIVKIRRQTDKLVPQNNFMADPVDAGVNTQIRRILNDAVYNKVTDGKDLGKKLKAYNDFNEAVSKTNLPSGKSRLMDTIKGGVFTSAAYNPHLILPILAGFIGKKALENPTVLSKVSSGVEGVGAGVKNAGAGIAGAGEAADKALLPLLKQLEKLNDASRNTGARSLNRQENNTKK